MADSAHAHATVTVILRLAVIPLTSKPSVPAPAGG